ncbi:hypothetical protein ACFVJ5_06980 [Nocardia sp. NPDC127606]|uniref:hypothetical protein n=1 Tax=Nocardia sp. NPDC127606 TaxID=3345406 RepID=UPI003627E018
MSSVADEAIISRLVTEDGRTLVVDVYRPKLVDGHAECTYRLADTRRATQGADELAALYRALTEIGDLLAQANNKPRARFLVPAHLGFPTSPVDHTTLHPAADAVARQTITHNGERHTITIGRPFHDPGQGYILCPFRVDDRDPAVASGWDSIDALLNAVAMIGGWLRLPRGWPLAT